MTTPLWLRPAVTHTKHCNTCDDHICHIVSASLSTEAQMSIDSLWTSRFLYGDVVLTQTSDDSVSNVKFSLI